MTVDQLNRTKLDPLSFRIYAALLCEQDMSINRLSYRTGMTRKAISKRLPSLISKQLVIKTNNRSKVSTYSGLDTTESIDATGEYNDSVVELKVEDISVNPRKLFLKISCYRKHFLL